MSDSLVSDIYTCFACVNQPPEKGNEQWTFLKTCHMCISDIVIIIPDIAAGDIAGHIRNSLICVVICVQYG